MPYNPQNVGYQNTDTSYQAAKDIENKALSLRDAVYAVICGSDAPISTEAIADALCKPEASIQPRTSELRNAELICDSGRRGETKWGKSCILWAVGKATPKAKTQDDELFPEIFGYAV